MFFSFAFFFHLVGLALFDVCAMCRLALSDLSMASPLDKLLLVSVLRRFECPYLALNKASVRQEERECADIVGSPTCLVLCAICGAGSARTVKHSEGKRAD